MTFHVFGLNHDSAPVRVREDFALDSEAQRRVYERLSLPEGAEVVLVSTCNRTEVYFYGREEDAAAVRQSVAEEVGTPWPVEDSFSCVDEEAVRHVLQVTCGLRSLVLGDNQILGQVKDAYRLAVESDVVSTVLHRLMHTAFRTAKRVVAETVLTEGAASVSSAAVAAARAFFEVRYPDGLSGRSVLLVGAGHMGVLALQALTSYRLGRLAVTNRTAERAADAAAEFGAERVPWEARYRAMAQNDLVIVATGADEPVFRAEHVPPAETEGAGTLVIDIAVPRNVEAALAERPGYTLLDLDLLNERLVRVEERRRTELPKAEAIVEETLREFVAWFFHQEALQPAIHAIRDTFEEIRRQELDRHGHRIESADRDELDRLTRSIMQKLLAIPIVRLKSTDPESIDFVRGIRLLRTLFSRPECDDADEPTPEPTCPFERSSVPDVADLQVQLQERIEAFDALQQRDADDRGSGT